MRTFENLLLPVDEWYITSSIDLDDNGCFRYRESWDCYAGSAGSEAQGNWRQEDAVIVLETKRVAGALRLRLVEGGKLQAVDRGHCLDFGNDFIMSARPATGTNHK